MKTVVIVNLLNIAPRPLAAGQITDTSRHDAIQRATVKTVAPVRRPFPVVYVAQYRAPCRQRQRIGQRNTQPALHHPPIVRRRMRIVVYLNPGLQEPLKTIELGHTGVGIRNGFCPD